MRFKSHFLVLALMALTLSESATIFNGKLTPTVSCAGETYLRLANGYYGRIEDRGDGIRVARFPDGTYRRDFVDPNASAFRVVVGAVRGKIVVPTVPKVHMARLTSIRETDAELRFGNPDKKRRRQLNQRQARNHQLERRESQGKLACIISNMPFDRRNMEPKQGATIFAHAEEARKKYGVDDAAVYAI